MNRVPALSPRVRPCGGVWLRVAVLELMLVVPAVLFAAPLAAQANLRIVAGLNRASLGDDGADASGLTRARTGFAVGAGVDFPLRPTMGLRAELLYSQKGGRSGQDANETVLRVDYIEAPVLFYLQGTKQQVRPTLVAGPYFAFRVSCSARTTILGSTSVNDCSSVGIPELRRLDYGVVVGAGFETGNVDAGVRFGVGLPDVAHAVAPVRTRVFSVLGAYRIRLLPKR